MSIICIFISVLSTAICQPSGVKSIDADKLIELQSEGVVLIDIRTPEEYTSGHIPSVAYNIDFLNDDFLKNMEEAVDKNQPIVIHCESGGRSKRAAFALEKAGYTRVYDYRGGFADWGARGEAIEK